MSTYTVEFDTILDMAAAARIVKRAKADEKVTDVRIVPGMVRIDFTADSNYTARTVGLRVQGGEQTIARIRERAVMFPGPWFDLNEEG